MKRNQFSKEYEKIIRYYNKMHKEGSGDENPENIFDGKSLRFFFSPIKQLIEKTKSESLIDFGCGKAKYYFNKIKVSDKIYNNVIDYWKINNYILYDPGVDKFLEYPNKSADAVICIDVVEHIPEEDVNVFIEELFKLANKFIFVVIAKISTTGYESIQKINRLTK